jgi:hypothetical protein
MGRTSADLDTSEIRVSAQSSAVKGCNRYVKDNISEDSDSDVNPWSGQGDRKILKREKCNNVWEDWKWEIKNRGIKRWTDSEQILGLRRRSYVEKNGNNQVRSWSIIIECNPIVPRTALPTSGPLSILPWPASHLPISHLTPSKSWQFSWVRTASPCRAFFPSSPMVFLRAFWSTCSTSELQSEMALPCLTVRDPWPPVSVWYFLQ